MHIRQIGLTLVELMVALAISLFVVLAAAGLLLSTRSGYVLHSEQAQITDTGRFAVDVITRTLMQASYINWDAREGPVFEGDIPVAAFSGFDSKSLKSRTNGMTAPLEKSINGSDVIAVGIFGAGPGENGDGTMLNCAGFGIGTAGSNSDTVTDDDRDWSMFYVAEDSTGEPELYCKYRGSDGWASQAIARGIESFQVLYGIDTDGDLMPNRFLNASGIEALDNGVVLTGANPADRAVEKRNKSYWRRVVTIKLALLVRGTRTSKSNNGSTEYALFGKEYADAYRTSDHGVLIRESDLRADVRGRERRVFTATVQLRSRLSGERS